MTKYNIFSPLSQSLDIIARHERGEDVSNVSQERLKGITESIFNGKSAIIPMADVQHIERQFHSSDLLNGAKKGDISGYIVVTKHTRWDKETGAWANNIYLNKEEGDKLLRAWCDYRYEAENLAELGVKMP